MGNEITTVFWGAFTIGFLVGVIVTILVFNWQDYA